MKIGIWQPDKNVLSVKIYTEEVVKRLEGKGVSFFHFGKNDAVPKDVDIIWDSTCTGGKSPNQRLLRTKIPIIATVHGAGPLSMPYHVTFPTPKLKVKGIKRILKLKSLWALYKPKIKHVVTVSNYAKQELVDHIGIKASKITPIYHGVDEEVFNTDTGRDPEKEHYLFHVSVYQPKKNTDRIIEAFLATKDIGNTHLIMVVPGYHKTISSDRVTIINSRMSRNDVAEYIKNASCFIFPSLHESFGMPLAEAMACGCPIITSNVTACPEIVGDAGLKVNPYEIDEISNAISKITNNDVLRAELSLKSLERAKQFSWDLTAEKHFEIFQKAVAKK